MRMLRGQIDLPPNTPRRRAALAVIEVRDISLADAPSQLVAQKRLRDLELEPAATIPFEMEVPEVTPLQALCINIHISMSGEARAQAGDLLTTMIHPIPGVGPLSHQRVAVKLI